VRGGADVCTLPPSVPPSCFASFVGLAKTIHVNVYTVSLVGKLQRCHTYCHRRCVYTVSLVGKLQSYHTYCHRRFVYVLFLAGKLQSYHTYCHIRCVCTVLANPLCLCVSPLLRMTWPGAATKNVRPLPLQTTVACPLCTPNTTPVLLLAARTRAREEGG